MSKEKELSVPYYILQRRCMVLRICQNFHIQKNIVKIYLFLLKQMLFGEFIGLKVHIEKNINETYSFLHKKVFFN